MYMYTHFHVCIKKTKDKFAILYMPILLIVK